MGKTDKAQIKELTGPDTTNRNRHGLIRIPVLAGLGPVSLLTNNNWLFRGKGQFKFLGQGPEFRPDGPYFFYRGLFIPKFKADTGGVTVYYGNPVTVGRNDGTRSIYNSTTLNRT
jgi:hypothetical protein